MKFLPYQERWIYDTSRMKVLEKSRRIGGTYSTSYRQFRKILRHTHHDIIAVTRDERLAAEFILDVSQWARMWNAVQPKSLEIPERCFKTLSLTIPHQGGQSRVIAVSSNPNAAIGRGGDLVLDEFAAHRDPELLMTLAQPIIMAGGGIEVLSTHRSRNSKFNEIVIDSQQPGSNWSHHRTTIYDAVEQGLVEQIVNPNMVRLSNEPWESREAFLEWLISTYDEFTFQQEFCCVPSDDATSLLTIDEVEQAVTAYGTRQMSGSATYLGYDCAESMYGDFATWSVLEHDVRNNNVEMIDQRYFERGTSINDQIEDVVATAKKYHVRRVVSDNAGIGRHPTTILTERLGEHIVIPFMPTLHSKGEMCTKVKRYFQNGWFTMQDDKHIKDDFLSIDRLITPSNNVVYSANRSGNIGHGDMFSAAAMALTEVPEKSRSEIKGVSSKSPDPVERLLETNNDRIERNRQADRRDKKTRSTY